MDAGRRHARVAPRARDGAAGLLPSSATASSTRARRTRRRSPAFETGTTIRFTRFGGPPRRGCAGQRPDGETVECPKTGIVAVELNLNGGDDVASVSAAVGLPVFFNGGDGNDGLFGGGGLDTFDGGPGNDNIVARDGRAEQVECASGNDTAITDDADNRVSCEQVEGDADGDGVRRPADCDDTKPQIRPGVPDVPDDGIDQDCSGADATNLDRDGDGFSRPQDCDDANAAVRPGAREEAGQRRRRELRRRDHPVPAACRVARQRVAGRKRRHPQRRAQCQGLPQGHEDQDAVLGRQLRDRRRPPPRAVREQSINLHRFLGNRMLRAGARVQLSFTRPGHVGRVLRYRMRSGGALPDVDFMCKRPGRKARAC